MSTLVIAFLMTFLPPLELQHVAQQRANYMAQRNYRWHPPYSVGRPFKNGARFEGAGWGGRNADPKKLRTCLPRYRGMKLVGDAFARGRYGTYRIRLWR